MKRRFFLALLGLALCSTSAHAVGQTGWHIQGRVVDQNGRPIIVALNVTVTYVDVNFNWKTVKSPLLQTDAQGNYQWFMGRQNDQPVPPADAFVIDAYVSNVVAFGGQITTTGQWQGNAAAGAWPGTNVVLSDTVGQR